MSVVKWFAQGAMVPFSITAGVLLFGLIFSVSNDPDRFLAEHVQNAFDWWALGLFLSITGGGLSFQMLVAQKWDLAGLCRIAGGVIFLALLVLFGLLWLEAR